MMKKNILAVALLSSALAIGGGLALARVSAPKAVEVNATIAYDTGNVHSQIGFSETTGDEYGYYYMHIWGGAKETNWPGVYVGHDLSEPYFFDATEYAGWTNVIITRRSAATYESDEQCSEWARFTSTTFAANSKNFFEVTGGTGYGQSALVASEQSRSAVKEYAVVDGVAEVSPFSTEYAWNSDNFTPTAPSRVGFDFGGWFTDAGCTQAYEVAPAAYDGKLYAKFTTKPLTWVMRGNGVAFPDKDSDTKTDFDVDDGLAMTIVNASEIKIENVTLTAGDKFKFNDGNDEGTWFGYSDIKTASPDADKFEDDGTGNIKVKTGKTGSYTFFVDVTAGSGTNNAIWITSANALALDSWAQGFVEAEDLCNGGGDEWSTFATSYATLSTDVKAYFAAAKVAASNEEHASWVAKAAYRYEKGVVLKDQAKFAENERPYDGYKDKYSTALSLFKVEKKNNIPAIIIATVSLGAIAAAAGFVFLRKKRNNA